MRKCSKYPDWLLVLFRLKILMFHWFSINIFMLSPVFAPHDILWLNLQWFCKFQKQLHFQVYKIKLGSDEKIHSSLSRLHKVFCELVIPFSHLLSTLQQTEGRLEPLEPLKARFRVVLLLFPRTGVVIILLKNTKLLPCQHFPCL